MPADDFTHTGQTNGARRRSRSRRATMRDDERPRGFEPDRMRRLWSDIDRSRDNLGLGTQPVAPSSWSVGGVVGRATELAVGAVGSLFDVLAAPARLLTAPTRALGDAVPCVRRLPIVGGLFE